MRKNITFAVIVFMISFSCLFGMVYTPQTIKEYASVKGDKLEELTVEDVTLANAVKLEETGEYKILDTDPYIVYDVSADGVKTILLKITEMDKMCPIFLYVDAGNGYHEELKYVSVIPEGSSYACFEITEEQILRIRFDIDTEVCIEGIELYSGEAVYTETKYPLHIGRTLFAVLFSIGLAAGAFFADCRWDMTGTIIRFFGRKKSEILKGTVAFLAAAVVSLPCEWILSHYIMYMCSRGTAFNVQRYCFIVCILDVLIFLFLMRNYIVEKVEAVVLGLILIIGSSMILIQPLAHCGWDVDSHYRLAHNSSYLGEAYVTMADYSFFTAGYESLVKANGSANLGNVRYMDMAYEYVIDVQETSISLPHLPTALAMAAVRLFGGSFPMIFLAGEFANLFVYAFLTYFSVKKLKSGKMILSVFALFPTNLLIAVNYSYDYWVTGFAMLGVAYFIGECQEKEHPVSMKDIVIMCGALALACVPKQIYVPLMLLPFLMPKEKIKNKKIFYAVGVICFVLLFGSLLVRTGTEASVGGDVRGGGDVSMIDQIYYILEHPIAFCDTLIAHLRNYLSLGWMHQAITNYANLGITTWGSNVLILLSLYTVVTDKKECDKNSSRWWIKGYVIAMYFGVAVLVSLSFYLVFTPVGASYIAGCQARYMFPVMIPFLLLAGPCSIKNTMHPKLYRYAILGTTVCIVLMDNFTAILQKML